MLYKVEIIDLPLFELALACYSALYSRGLGIVYELQPWTPPLLTALCSYLALVFDSFLAVWMEDFWKYMAGFLSNF